MRQYIRHPADIPIEIRTAESRVARQRIRNVSEGGLAFESDSALPRGCVIKLRISYVQPAFESEARVVWCRAALRGYEMGVVFLSAEDAFRARMVEQVCQIERYKKTVLEAEGRALSAEEAAQEWITKFAAAFPNPGRH
jgi:hypothetical protein